MSVDQLTSTVHVPARSRLFARLAAAWARAQRRRRIAATARTLQSLDDDTLRDIGVQRGRIREVAEGIEDQAGRG